MIFSDQGVIGVIVHLISMRIENLSRAAEADNRFIAGGEIINMGVGRLSFLLFLKLSDRISWANCELIRKGSALPTLKSCLLFLLTKTHLAG